MFQAQNVSISKVQPQDKSLRGATWTCSYPHQEGRVLFSVGGCHRPHLMPQISFWFHKWFSNQTPDLKT